MKAINTNEKSRIHIIRNEPVILDSEIAKYYEVELSYLKRKVREHIDKFPEDFMFKLTNIEIGILMFKNAIPDSEKNRRVFYVFTELGVAGLSFVLNSKKAIKESITIARLVPAFDILLKHTK